jgi:tetratricopeptide (TPR) repeat protein
MLLNDEGIRATVAMLSTLYLLEAEEVLQRFLGSIRDLEPYRSFFQSLIAYDQGKYASAAEHLQHVLKTRNRSVPASIRFAALMLAAEAEMKAGFTDIANREFRLLSKRNAEYVRDWARLMLANDDWRRGDHKEARERFGVLCGEEGRARWKPLSCLLASYLEHEESVLKGKTDE